MFQLPQPKVFREKHNKKINQTSPPRRPRLRKAKPFELDDLDEIQTSSIKKPPHKLAPPKTNWLGFTKWEVFVKMSFLESFF